MAAVGCLEKEIQFQKETIEEQDVRQAKDRLPTKNIYIRLKTLLFYQKHPSQGPTLRLLSSSTGIRHEDSCSTWSHIAVGWVSIPWIRCPPRPLPCAPARFGRRCADMAASDMTSSRPGTENGAALPFPDHETKSLPAHRRRGPAIRTRAKVLQGEGDRGRGTLFQKRPPPPENTRPPPSKTMLQLPRQPPRRHLPKRARQGERLPQRDQASATARAGGP